MGRTVRAAPILASAVAVCLGYGCTSQQYRERTDKTAKQIIHEKQQATLGKTEPFTIERPADTLRRRLMIEQKLPHSAPASLGTQNLEPIKHWPKDNYLTSTTRPADPFVDRAGEAVIKLTLLDALKVAAWNSREYQARKEAIFQDALQLDLARDEFRPFFSGAVTGDLSRDLTGDKGVTGAVVSPSLGVEQQFKNGARVSANILYDLAKLLTGDHTSASGLASDISVSMPMLRGAGEYVVTEPLTQAERNVAYDLLEFEQYKRTFVVNIASQYLSVLQRLDALRNAEDNYRRLIVQAARSRVMAQAGRLPPFQMDQAISDELSARDSWLSSQASYTDALDAFKVLMGLPPDAHIELQRTELRDLAFSTASMLNIELPASIRATTRPAATQPVINPLIETPTTRPTTQSVEEQLRAMPTPSEVVLDPPDAADAGRFELPEAKAIGLALENRPDLRVARGAVYDAERKVTVAANALQAGLNLTATGSAGLRRNLGATNLPDAAIRFDQGRYNFGFDLDLPFERTAEAAAYRSSYIALEQAVREFQAAEDQIKLAVRNRLTELLQARESLKTQTQAVIVAERRVDSTQMLFEAGRVEIRDVLDATATLTRARNALTSALVDYRVAELAIERDLGVLEVNEEGIWREYIPR